MDRFYLGVLQGCSQLGGAIIRRLVSHFGSGRQVWQVQAGERAVREAGERERKCGCR